ncbi:MAG: hypothetical protein U1E02_29845, partial [Hydrogenophaga sp.]|nr:hypothetical protein [Hydrogenophaga sp.]
AGGTVIESYDADGFYLGSTVKTFGGDSVLRITADEQIRLGRDLIAGKLIDVRGGVSQHPVTAEDPWADEGIVIGGNVQIRTWQQNSTINLSAAGDMSVLTPAWTQEIVADGFAEYADGRLSEAVSLQLTVEQGSVDAVHVITVGTTRSNGAGLGALRDDLQTAIDTAFGYTDATNRRVSVRLDDGRLMLTSNFELRLAAVSGGGAQRLGFTQIADVQPSPGPTTSARSYALDASARGSVINLGRANAPAGAITISGSIRGHSAVNMFAGTNALGNQSVTFSATSLVETLSGSMVMRPAGAVTIEGDFVARGVGANIVIQGTGTLDLKGSLTAQRDILISAGTSVREGEVSVRTYGTSVFTTLDAGSRIVIAGVNDVVIDSVIGKGNVALGLVQLGSSAGSLSILAGSGWVESGTKVVLSGKNVDVAGVVRNNQATDLTFDDELSISATHDVRLYGAIGIVGTIAVTAGDDIEIAGMALSAERIRLNATDAITLGGLGAGSGLILEVSSLLSAQAGGLLTQYGNALFFSTADSSRIALEARSMTLLGAIEAGVDHPVAFIPSQTSMGFDGTQPNVFSGKAATLDLRAQREIVLGNLSTGEGGRLVATGAIQIQSGTHLNGTGFEMSASSQIKVDATGEGTWSETLIDASSWQVVAGTVYTVNVGSETFSVTAGVFSTLNHLLDALVLQIDAHAGLAAERASDVITLTAQDGSALTQAVSV